VRQWALRGALIWGGSRFPGLTPRALDAPWYDCIALPPRGRWTGVARAVAENCPYRACVFVGRADPGLHPGLVELALQAEIAGVQRAVDDWVRCMAPFSFFAFRLRLLRSRAKAALPPGLRLQASLHLSAAAVDCSPFASGEDPDGLRARRKPVIALRTDGSSATRDASRQSAAPRPQLPPRITRNRPLAAPCRGERYPYDYSTERGRLHRVID
jgi:hypothetical protein